MMLRALHCESCGGSIAFPEGTSSPSCPFCGSTKQVQLPMDLQKESPDYVLPFAITDQEADAAFRSFAQSSFWYPADIRQARLELKAILLPAWIWSGTVESHYSGLVSASTRSGKRPISGSSRTFFNQILIPSSRAVSLSELSNIAPFEGTNAVSFSPEELQYPYELGELTRRVAIKECQQEMNRRHQYSLQRELSATELNCSSVYEQLSGAPALLPVFIGVYRRKEHFYRIVINGTNGNIVGEAPFAWGKLIIICAATLAVLLLLLMFAS